jgi:hypothetical protein
MVRRVALDHLIGVRIPVSQPVPFINPIQYKLVRIRVPRLFDNSALSMRADSHINDNLEFQDFVYLPVLRDRLIFSVIRATCAWASGF